MLHRFQRHGQGAANVFFVVNDQDAHQRNLILVPGGWEPQLYVTRLRQKIETDSTKPRLIKTEPGIGYRFESGEA
jgi:hypothetical protein